MALVAFSGLNASVTIASSDIFAVDVGGITKKITAGNFRNQLFGFAATDPLNCGILTAVGASTITGALSGITALSAQTLALSGNVLSDLLFTDATYDIGKTGATRPRDLFLSRNLVLGGTLLTATTATTSVKNLKLTFDRNLVDAIDLTDSGGYARWQIGQGSGGGSDGIGFYNVTAALLRFEMRANGDFSITTGDLRLQAGKIVFVTAASKIIPGATSFSHRNNADSADNLLISDAGDVTVRARLIAATASAKFLIGATSLDFRDSTDTGSRLLISNASPVVQVSNGRLNTAAATTSYASVLIPSGTAPTSPVSGELWYNGTNLMFRDGGTTRTITWV